MSTTAHTRTHTRTFPGLRTGVATVPATAPTLGAADEDESGRGLVLIDAFADDWGPLSQGQGLYFTLTRDDFPAVRP